MGIETSLGEDGGGGGVAVLLVDLFDFGGGQQEDVVPDFSGRPVEADGAELFAVGGRGGDPDQVVPDDGRGVPLAWNLRGPGDVARLAPFEGWLCIEGEPLSGGSAKLRPASGLRGDAEGIQKTARQKRTDCEPAAVRRIETAISRKDFCPETRALRRYGCEKLV